MYKQIQSWFLLQMSKLAPGSRAMLPRAMSEEVWLGAIDRLQAQSFSVVWPLWSKPVLLSSGNKSPQDPLFTMHAVCMSVFPTVSKTTWSYEGILMKFVGNILYTRAQELMITFWQCSWFRRDFDHWSSKDHTPRSKLKVLWRAIIILLLFIIPDWKRAHLRAKSWRHHAGKWNCG